MMRKVIALVVVILGLLTSLAVDAQRSQMVKDYDGNWYRTVKIGDQVWMAENLKVTHFRNGISIPNVTNNEKWWSMTSPAYCAYDNNPANAAKYGLLYNFYAAADSVNKLAPAGWHVATNDDWKQLQDYLIKNKYNFDKSDAEPKFGKALAAKTDWSVVEDIYGGAVCNDLSKNNSTGFGAVPGGYRYDAGLFYDKGISAYWWTSTEFRVSVGWYRAMRNDYWGLFTFRDVKAEGFSVRCVKDKK